MSNYVKAEPADSFDIRFTFEDDIVKTTNLKSFIGNGLLTKLLNQMEYFKTSNFMKEDVEFIGKAVAILSGLFAEFMKGTIASYKKRHPV